MTVRLSQAALKQLANGSEVHRLLDDVGQLIAADARNAAPRGTGAMAASITHEVGQDTNGPYVRVSWDKDHWYGMFIEFGTSRMPARPFLRPAAAKRRTL